MTSLSYTDARLQSCKHPRLREALSFPQVTHATQKLEPIPAATQTKKIEDELSVGELVAQKTLTAIFKTLSVLLIPMKRMGGGLFASHQIQMA